MAFLRSAAALVAVLGSVIAGPAETPAPDLHPFRHPNFAAFAGRDPGLSADVRASTMSGLHAYRTLDRPPIAGYLEPSEGIVGECGRKFYAAVPLDTGTAAGIAGWLIYRPALARHVAVVQGSEGLEFRQNRIRASSFIYDPKTDSSATVHRVDSWVCRASELKDVESHVVPVP